MPGHLVKGSLHRFRDQDDGQGLVEYVLVISFVAIAALGALAAFGLGVNGLMADVASALWG